MGLRSKAQTYDSAQQTKLQKQQADTKHMCTLNKGTKQGQIPSQSAPRSRGSNGLPGHIFVTVYFGEQKVNSESLLP